MTLDRPLCLLASLALWMGTFTPSLHAEDPPAPSLPFSVEQAKEKIRRWPALAQFNQWKIVEVRLGAMGLDGLTQASLFLSPPDGWSERGVNYRVSISCQLDGSGSPIGSAGQHQLVWRKLSMSARQFIRQAENHEDVRAFLDRYAPVRGEITLTAGLDKLQVAFQGSFGSERMAAGTPQLTFNEGPPAAIIAYRVPRIDGLPVRRELLRFTDVMSQRYPRCLPSWIEARQFDLAAASESDTRWKIEVNLAGESCPPCFAAVVGSDGSVSQSELEETPNPQPL